jgi:hypothetical protein
MPNALEQTRNDLHATAVTVADIAIELNGVANDLGGDRESLRLRAIGLQAEASEAAHG